MAKRRNSISGQFAARLVEMLESPAYRALSLSAHRVVSRLEIELGNHGGNDNGKLPVTKQDFIAYGISNDQVAPAIREAEALGLVKVTQHGRGGNAEHRQPNHFYLTYAHGRDSKARPPTDDWRQIKTIEEAKEIARQARAACDPIAVKHGQRAAHKFRSRSGKPGPGPVRETRTETCKSPVRETRTTGSVRKPGLLSISRGEEQSVAEAGPAVQNPAPTGNLPNVLPTSSRSAPPNGSNGADPHGPIVMPVVTRASMAAAEATLSQWIAECERLPDGDMRKLQLRGVIPALREQIKVVLVMA